ncbi:MAG: TrpR-like protein, YerC/YecD [Oscillospiraceae bacterium]|nr:TrpR-like protein, YerC/YecD [Oscillospiraceae bacterium]
MAFKLQDQNAEDFFRAILSLENFEECANFFEDLCTIKELQAMIQRLHVAQMLSNGKLYSEIVKQTGASTATISRVNRALAYGSDGYKCVLERLEK